MSEFEVVLGREFARAARYREPLAVLLIDVASTGEAIGAIRDGVRLCDSVMTSGQERVAVILPETALPGALQVASRLGGVLAPSGPPPGQPAPSIGIGIYPSPQAGDPAALVRSAEVALEQARSRGGGTVFR
jgi:GGDEF domain-containing protein